MCTVLKKIHFEFVGIICCPCATYSMRGLFLELPKLRKTDSGGVCGARKLSPSVSSFSSPESSVPVPLLTEASASSSSSLSELEIVWALALPAVEFSEAFPVAIPIAFPLPPDVGWPDCFFAPLLRGGIPLAWAIFRLL